MAVRTDIYSVDWTVSPRVIWISDTITEADAQDLYDTCKYLEAEHTGVDEPILCDAGGWEPLGSGNFVVITISLFNAVYAFEDRPGPDWVICNMAGGNVVAFTDDTRTVTLYPRKPTSYVSADRTSSSSGTLKEAAAIEYASYQNAVWIDILDGYEADMAKYNREYPGKDLVAAISVARSKGFSILQVISSMTLGSSTDFSKFRVKGQSHVNTEVEVTDDAICNGVVFTDLQLSGVLDGGNEIRFCRVSDLQYVNGHIHESGLAGKITLGGSFDAFIDDCNQIDVDIVPEVDMGGSGQDLIVTNYRGHLKISNLTGANKISMSVDGAHIRLDTNTVTSGTFQIIGVGLLTDELDNPIFTGIWNGGVTIINEVLSKSIIADAVWDEVLTGDNHSIPTSAGRRLRELAGSIIMSGEVVSATINTVTFDGDASIVDGAYDPSLISIIEGIGAGQSRLCYEYKGSTKTAVVDRNWKIIPDATSKFIIYGHPGREHINEGLARGGGLNTIILNILASPIDSTYNGQTIAIRSGTGEDQACKVLSYDGSLKQITICKDWDVIPDTTSAYVILPTGVFTLGGVANAVWDKTLP